MQFHFLVAADGGLLSQKGDPRAHVPPTRGAPAQPALTRALTTPQRYTFIYNSLVDIE